MLKKGDQEEIELLTAVASTINCDPKIEASLIQSALALKPQLVDEGKHDSLSSVVQCLDPYKDKATIHLLLDNIQQYEPTLVVQAKKSQSPERLSALKDTLSNIDPLQKDG